MDEEAMITMRICTVCQERKSARLFKRGGSICNWCRSNYYTSARATEIRANRKIAKTVKGWGYAL